MQTHDDTDRAPAAAALSPDRADVEVALGLKRGFGRHVRRVLLWVVLLGGAGVGAWLLYADANKPVPPPVWQTEAVAIGDVVTTVSATGTVEPVSVVDVGAEISARVVTVDADFNDRVQAGQVLATLDTQALEAKKMQVDAQLASAKASVTQASASFTEAKQSETRIKALRAKGVATEQSVEAATATRARAYAQLTATRAQQKVAEAQVQAIETDLSKAVIKAPITGMILNRQVEPGNVVAASLQTPVLFTIAEDLTKMELQLAIDEADVGRVAAGMTATFTVDAHPGKRFDATVRAVHFAPTLTQTVVTYKAILDVDNDELLLRPGMTATAAIVSSAERDVLRVPNMALRLRPADYLPKEDEAASSGGNPLMPRFGRGGRRGRRGGARAGGDGGPGARGDKDAAARGARKRGRVFVLRDGQPTEVRVEIGPSDGAWTRITTDQLKDGDAVLVGAKPAEAS